MTWDLLEGRVDRPAISSGSGSKRAIGFADRLRAIADDPCPPDVIGINHYLTSDRYLDHRSRAVSAGRVRGATDAKPMPTSKAIRVPDSPTPAGLPGVLEEAWARYGRTLAVTECHSGCTREEQMRWLARRGGRLWTTCARDGVDVEAVTPGLCSASTTGTCC